MHALKILTSVALLISPILAQTDITQLLAQIPACTLTCGEALLPPAGCQFTNLTSCLCTNTDLQRELALCTLQKCNLTEQVETLTFLQNDICRGVPQPSLSEAIIRDIIIMAAVTFPVIFLRFWSRSLVTNKIGWDDWTVGLGTLIMIPMTVIPILNATRGFGKHFWDVPPQNLLDLRKLYYISQILYALVQALSKVSILFLYLRIFIGKPFRLVTMITMVWIVSQTIAFVLVVSFQCTPVDSYWDVRISGKCINSQAFVYAAAGVSIFEDFFIMFLPVWELKALKLDLRKKTTLGFMFALGSFACVTSLIRLKYIISYGTSIDLTYDNVDVVIWSVLEVFTGMICASLMCYRPLLLRLLPSVFLTTKSESKHTQNKSWGQLVSLKLGSKLRTGNNGVQLSSLDEESRGRNEKEIRVQTTWATEITAKDSQDRGPREELGERSQSQGALCRSDSS